MTTPSEAPAVANHVFLDYENVRKVDTAFFCGKSVTLTLLLGATTKRLDVELVEKLLQHSASVEVIRLNSAGKNALDFTLAYYLGRKTLSDPGAFFHVVTKDKGYDPLIEHLKSTGIEVDRYDDCSSLTFSAIKKTAGISNRKPSIIPASKAETPGRSASFVLDTAVEFATNHLKKAKNRPRTKTRLLGYLKSNVGNRISANQANQIVQRLVKEKHIAIDEKGRVTYH